MQMAQEFEDEATNLKAIWNVQRGVDEMNQWSEKITGYKEHLFYLFFFIIFCVLIILQVNPKTSYGAFECV